MSSENQTGPLPPARSPRAVSPWPFIRELLREVAGAMLAWATKLACVFAVAVAVIVPAVFIYRSTLQDGSGPPDIESLVPPWFLIAHVSAAIICLASARRVARRIVNRRFGWPAGRWEPPTRARLDLLGRRWPYVVTASFAAVFGVVTACGAIAVALVGRPDWALAAVLWLPLLPAGCLWAFLEAGQDDLLGDVLWLASPPPTRDFRYNESGFQARIQRYARWAKFYEDNGLLTPSPALYTARQRERIMQAYEVLLMHIEAWEAGEDRVKGHEGCVDPACRDCAALE